MIIDLHCHLLPGLDDGPATWEETLALARQLVVEGIKQVAATPHSYSPGGRDRKRILALTKEANLRFSNQGIPIVVFPGMEIILTELTTSQLRSGQLLPLGDSKTILLETSAYIEFKELEHTLGQIKNIGYQVLLAHPEKIESLYDYPNMLLPLVREGMATQITAASLAGLNGTRKQNMCQQLLLYGMAHVVASDAHAAEGPRRPALKEGLASAQELLGSKAIHLFSTIPRMILESKELPKFQPREM